MTFIIPRHCSLGGNFLADTFWYLSWPALSRSWHLAASGMGLGVTSHQAGLLTTLHHFHVCFPEQGGNMVTTMGCGFSDFWHLFCFTLLINKAFMYHNHIPLMYIFNSPANECWVSFYFKSSIDQGKRIHLPSVNLASIGAHTEYQSIDTQFGILTVNSFWDRLFIIAS